MALTLRKLDLHVHTPASHDFADKSVTAEKIVRHAKKCGLDGIAITDHNSVDFVDAARAAAQKLDFTVFPGIEISCGGGSSGSIHVIALFDPSTTQAQLQMVLGGLEIKGRGEEALTAKSVSDVINIVRAAGGLPVLAHANSTHGVFSDMKGQPRIEIVQNPKLAAAEATAADFAKPVGKRAIDFLDGKDPLYGRKLAVYQASDNRDPAGGGHCLTAIGSAYSYFRMGELTIGALRQCFDDPDSRIVQQSDSSKLTTVHPRITKIEITGGFLDGQNIAFSPGMNSIIGGTGTGKSLIVEFLRYAFDRKPEQATLYAEHRDKLEQQLRASGRVVVEFIDASGEEYRIERTYGNPKNPYATPITCTNKTTGASYTGDVRAIFPLLIYSQNEILEITRDQGAQLALLDSFRDFAGHRADVVRIKQDLGHLDHELSMSVQSAANLDALLRTQSTLSEQMGKLKRTLGKDGKKGVAERYLKLHEERGAIETQIDAYDKLIEQIDAAVDDFLSSAPRTKKEPEGLRDRIAVALRGQYDTVIAGLKERKMSINAAKASAQAQLATWLKQQKFKELEGKYTAEVRTQKTKEKAETDRQRLAQDKRDIDAQVEAAKNASTELVTIRAKRAALLQELSDVRQRYFAERTEQAQLVTDKSDGRLQLSVKQGDNNAVYIGMLKELKVGSRAESKQIEEIAGQISPVDLVEMVLNNDSAALVARVGLTEQMAAKIIAELGRKENLMATLSLQYDGYPDDSVDIQYQKKGGTYHPLSQLSMGQKADALIMIALGDGGMPLVIDQPEDALDVPSIWADICTKLRLDKHGRQFVFTTHNSSISVSSDSDQFIILEADGTQGRVTRSGSIDQKDVREDVIDHLEGGRGSYDLKRKKYDL